MTSHGENLQEENNYAACGQTAAHAKNAPLTPETVLAGKYLVLHAVDESRLGATYPARDTRLNIEVLVKEYLPEGSCSRLASTRVAVCEGKEALFSGGLERFLQETQKLARFDAERGGALVRDFFRENGTAYVALETAPGAAREAYRNEAGPLADEALFLLGLAGPAPAHPPEAEVKTPVFQSGAAKKERPLRKPPVWALALVGMLLAAALFAAFLPRGGEAGGAIETPAPTVSAADSPTPKAAFGPPTAAPAQETPAPAQPTPVQPTPTPAPLTRAELAQTNRFTVACGNRHVAYIRPDGSFGGVGSDLYGQLSGATSGASVLRQLAAGYAHTAMLFEDGSVRATKILRPAGEEPYEYGQSDVESWRHVVEIEAGWVHTVGLLSDGSVVAAGDNAHGQCDVDAWRDVAELAAGGWNTAALTSDGRVLVAGDNEYGQCDIAWENENIVHLAVGRQFVLGLRADGTVIAAGRNLQNQLEVTAWRGIVQIAAGDHHAIGLTDEGRVVTTSFTGKNAHGQDLTGGWENVIAIYGGARSTVGLTADGNLLVAGLVDQDTYAQTGAMAEKAAIFIPSRFRGGA